MKTPFDNDAVLADGLVDIADSLTPPPEYGTFGIRWPYDSLDSYDELEQINLVLWSCMDRRVLRPLYDKALKRGYRAENILLLSMAGGPVQIGKNRIAALSDIFDDLEEALPQLEKVWAVAHIGVCAGVKSFCGGEAITEALKPQYKAQASAKGIDPELYAMQLVLPGAYRLLPETWHTFTELAIAEPVEATQSVKLYSRWFTPSDSKTLGDIVDHSGNALELSKGSRRGSVR